MSTAKKRYTVTYGHEPKSFRSVKLLLWSITVIFGALLLQEVDAALGITWGDNTSSTVRWLYELTRMLFGAGAILSFLWATRATAVKITSH